MNFLEREYTVVVNCLIENTTPQFILLLVIK